MMGKTEARRIALQVNEFYKNSDPYNYADALEEFDNNEELLLEDTLNTLMNNPGLIITELLTYIENYQED